MKSLASVLACVVLASVASAGTPPTGAADPNQIPNALLLDRNGAVAGNVTGTAPTLWRAIALTGGAMDVSSVALAADALFPGSPPATAVRISVSAFGTDQVFDHAPALFTIVPGRTYQARIYVRSGNADASPQTFRFGMPLFDTALAFTGRDPANFTQPATSAWTAFDSPTFTADPGDAYGHVSFRLQNDGGENTILVALPTLLGPAVANEAPNPAFTGTGGASQGTVTGAIPNAWRAFAVGAGSLTVATEPLAAGALFPGSTATTAVRLQVTSGNGSSEGFDHQQVRAPLAPGHRYWSEVWIRAGGATDQGVTISMPIFDAGGTFTGNQPGSTVAIVGPQWRLVAGPPFSGAAGETANLAFRLAADGGEDSLLIAAPRIVGPARPVIFGNGFE